MDETKSLHLIKPLSWEEVFSLWRAGEAHLPRWIEHYKADGFTSWDEWREHTLKNLAVQNLQWNLFSIDDPVSVVPHFLGGPFRSWMKKYYEGAHMRPFEGIIKYPELQNSEMVQEMIANFPKKTYLVGLRTPQGIVILEGMHRSSALALAALKNIKIDSRIFLALAEYSGEIPEMGNVNSPT
jgi:hypothetical protein